MPAIDKLYLTCKCGNSFFISPDSLVPNELSRTSYSQPVTVMCPNCRHIAHFTNRWLQEAWVNLNNQIAAIEKQEWTVTAVDPSQEKERVPTPIPKGQ